MDSGLLQFWNDLQRHDSPPGKRVARPHAMEVEAELEDKDLLGESTLAKLGGKPVVDEAEAQAE